MPSFSTDAWVLYRGERTKEHQPGELVKETITIPELEPDEVHVETLFGCWETNMTHAIERAPVDIARMRREKKIVLGNAGTVRVLRTGSAVTDLAEGDICGIVPIGMADSAGYLSKVFGYDAPGTIGLMAKETKVNQTQLQKLPLDTGFTWQQWAAFTLRYSTAWSNWRVAFGAWRLQMNEEQAPETYVWGWGGGVVLGELLLAKHFGCRAAMIASTDERLQLIRDNGLTAIDRREFPNLNFDEERYETDRPYRSRYLTSEKKLLEIVSNHTGGHGVSIFLENIGTPVFRATLRALGRQGVISTVGWLRGMKMSISRANECINRHTYIHTHGASSAEGVEAMNFAIENRWMPEVDENIYNWADIPRLAEDFRDGKIESYFPIYAVNPV